MATHQPDDPAFGITDGSDDRLELALASAQSEAVLVANRPSFGKACVAGGGNGFRVIVTDAISDFFFPDIFG
jgi:hypothetical protein